METIFQKHHALYGDNGIALLEQLLAVLADEPVFVYDVDPDVEIVNPYFRTDQYPLWQASENFFSIGIEIKRKFLWCFPYTAVKPIGNLAWTISGGHFSSFTFRVHDKATLSAHLHELTVVAETLENQFGCPTRLQDSSVLPAATA